MTMAMTLKARVRGGRLVLDEPTELPDGSEVDLVIADEGDELDEEERARLHAAIDESLAEPHEDAVDAADLIAELRSRR